MFGLPRPGSNAFSILFPRSSRSVQVLNHFNLLTWDFSVSNILPEHGRQCEITELFAELNREVTVRLRKHIGVGWCLPDMLPSIRTYILRKGQYGQSKEHDYFWSSLGMPSMGSTRYENDGILIFPPDGLTRRSSSSSMQVMIPQGFIDQRAKADHTNKDTEAWFCLWMDDLLGLMPILAVQEQVRRLANEIALSRTYFGSALAGHRHMGSNLFFRGAFTRMTLLNSLSFRLKRLTEELKFSRKGSPILKNLQNFHRERWREEDSGAMLDDLEWQTNQAVKIASAQLKLLKENYHEMLSYRLQQVLLLLAFTTAVLTALLLVLEVMRPDFLASVRETLGHLFS